LPGVVGCDRDLAGETIPPHHLDRALEHQPRRCIWFAHIKNGIARCENLFRSAGEALRGLDLRSVEHGKHLLTSCVDDAHRGFSWRGMLLQA